VLDILPVDQVGDHVHLLVDISARRIGTFPAPVTLLVTRTSLLFAETTWAQHSCLPSEAVTRLAPGSAQPLSTRAISTGDLPDQRAIARRRSALRDRTPSGPDSGQLNHASSASTWAVCALPHLLGVVPSPVSGPSRRSPWKSSSAPTRTASRSSAAVLTCKRAGRSCARWSFVPWPRQRAADQERLQVVQAGGPGAFAHGTRPCRVAAGPNPVCRSRS
jgi:hypothetical protein